MNPVESPCFSWIAYASSRAAEAVRADFQEGGAVALVKSAPRATGLYDVLTQVIPSSVVPGGGTAGDTQIV